LKIEMATYASVPAISVTALNKNERRRPVVSATTPVGISKSTVPTVNAELATKTWKMFKPESRRNNVFTPQITDAESVKRPEMTR